MRYPKSYCVLLILMSIFSLFVFVQGRAQEKNVGEPPLFDGSRLQCTLLVKPTPISNTVMDTVFTCSLLVRGVPEPGCFAGRLLSNLTHQSSIL